MDLTDLRKEGISILFIKINKMQRTYISDLKEKIGEKVRIRGRVDTIRDQGKIIFLIIRDKTGKVQSVAWHNDEEVF